MLQNYIKTAWRNLKKGKLFSFINISGLSIGMAVTMIIGIWVWDELNYDKSFQNYERIGQAWQFVTFDAEKASYNSMPIPLADELRTNYPDIEKSSVASYNRSVILGTPDKKLLKEGMFTEASFPEMLTLKMVTGPRNSLKDMNSILIAESTAKTLFGKEDPINKTIRIDNKADVQVAGVYEDFRDNTSFNNVTFLGSWQLFQTMDNNAKISATEWDNNSFQIFVQLRKGASFDKVSASIKDIRLKRADPPTYKPEFFIHPMSKWHLQGDFKNGVNTGGLIRHVRLFGIAGLFVLLLACINFMNLSTARSEKRAKEVGIRKTIGSVRTQLIYQFFSESVLLALIAFLFCIAIVQISLPFFNELANKKMGMPWTNTWFWLLAIGFCLITGLIAGSYPAIYLSSFKPIKVLKGTFKAGRFAATPRKAMLVFQFCVSIILIIGTIVVYRQIQYAKDRPMGYDSDRLIEVSMMTPEIRKNYDVLRTELLKNGYIKNISRSMGSVTTDYGGTTAITWKGKAQGSKPLLIVNLVSFGYGKTLGWKLVAGRDFSEELGTDSSAMVLNQSAAKLMGIKDPAGQIVKLTGKEYHVIGVVGDMIKLSPFDAIKPSVFTINLPATNIMNIRIAAGTPIGNALAKMEPVFKKYNPEAPFEYKFVDEQYGLKFYTESKVARLAGFFAVLAIFISCLGLFGLASYVAEQRTREIGVRKVLGATVVSVWKLLSKDFVMLVVISMIVATPVAWYFMKSWLENYEYRIDVGWWVFGITGLGVLFLTLAMVSYQTIKVALINPVKSLRSE